jgi:intracellular sulfur oxidation DsrE/DsrF family protein
MSAAMLITAFTFAQNPNYRVVFDMTSKDSVNQQSLLRQLKGISDGNPDAQLEVVVYGQALGLVMANGAQQAAVSELIGKKNITFKVCGMAMKRQQIESSQLLPGVQVTPDGIYEIIQRQQQGWGYIKVAH